jgi:spermidine/putrescine transport system ATP-binding protein
MSEKVVVLQNVVKSFAAMTAVKDVSLEVEQGEFVALIGPSGCGKTTTMRLIAGLEEPTSGDIYINGERVNEVKPWKRDTPLVWQNFALFPYLNVAKNVEFGLRMKKIDKAERRERVRRALAQVRISELAGRDISQLSGGQKQRVALARGLALDPKVLLLDEPLGSLDAHLRIRMQSELRQLQKELGITFVYVTHNQSEALAMADRVVVMNAGEIQQVGPPREVYREPANRFVAEFVGTNNIFTGEVQGFTEGDVTVVTPSGAFGVPVRNGAPPAQGSAITFVIGADRIRTSFEGDLHANRVEGVLRGQEFVGSVVTLFLELADGSEFRIQKQERESARITTQLGERMTVSWNPDEAYVLPEA